MCEFLETGVKKLITLYKERGYRGTQKEGVDELLNDLQEIVDLNKAMVAYDRGLLTYAPNKYDGVPLRLVEGQKVVAVDDIPESFRSEVVGYIHQTFGAGALMKFQSTSGIFIPLAVYGRVCDHNEKTVVTA